MKKKERGEIERRRGRDGERGSVFIFLLVIVLILSIGFFSMYGQLRIQLRATQDFEKRAVSYYGAEAGLQVALAAVKAGASAANVWVGRVGRGVYRSELSFESGGFLIISRGYYLPHTDEELEIAVRDLEEGGGHKSSIRMEGSFEWGGLSVGKWETYP